MTCRYQLIESNKGKNKSVIVKELGNPSFQYPINIKELKCKCSEKPLIGFCRHIDFYLLTKGIHHDIIPFLKVPALRNTIKEKNMSVEDMVEECKKYLFDDDYGCSICLQSFIAPGESLPEKITDKFYVCPNCENIFHRKCQQQWNNGCAQCRRGTSPP